MERKRKWPTREQLEERRAKNLCRDCGAALPEGRVRYCNDCIDEICAEMDE